MFDIFFSEYKNLIYKTTTRKFNKFVCYYIILSVCFLSLILWFKFYHNNLVMGVVFAIGFSLSTIIMISYHEKKNKKTIENRIQDKINNKIIPLIELTKKADYNLYSECGIDWLIKNCSDILSENKESDISTTISKHSAFIFPIILLIHSLINNYLSIDRALSFSIMLILLYIFLCVIWNAIKQLDSMIMFPNKEKYECLLRDLEYIKTQMYAEKT